MSTQYKSGADVPTSILATRLKELADVVAYERDRIDAEFTLRIPAECDRDADLVMYGAAVRLEALQAECEELRTALIGARANDQQAMAYLGAVKAIVGGDDFPDMVERCKKLRKDAERLDWLADPTNRIGNVQLPRECVERNPHSLRDAIDDAIRSGND